MSGRQKAEVTIELPAGPRSFVVRLTLVILLLGVPILGISGYFVTQVSAEIATAANEHQALITFARIARLYPLLETLHRSILSGTRREQLEAREQIDRAAVIAQRRLVDAGNSSANIRRTWNRWHDVWARVREAPRLSDIDALVRGLIEVNTQVEIDSPLEFDPSTAIQDLAEVILREDARSDAALRQTVDAVLLSAYPALSRSTVAAIATGQALAFEPLTLEKNDLADAMSLEPHVGETLRLPIAVAESRTHAFRSRIVEILAAGSISRADAWAAERSARSALDAHQRLSLLTWHETDALVLQRMDRLVVRRRGLVACSLVSFMIATLGIILIGRDMARRDRIEVAAAKLDGEKLRAELANVSMERALRLQEEQFKTIFDNTDLGIVIYNEHAHITQYNAAVQAILGTLTQPMLGDQQEAIARFRTPHCAPFAIEKRVVFEDGRVHWIDFRYSGQYEQDSCRMVVMLIRDVTADKLIQQQLAHAAHHDSLTRIANRAAFDKALTEQIQNNTTGARFVLMLIDLDHFKPINDTYGHAGGDRVLIATAERLVAALSSEDMCARLGGDEFAVMLHGSCDLDIVQAIADRILKGIALPVSFGEAELHVTASIGIAVGSRNCDAAEIKKEADLALYKAKEAGRNTYAVHEPTSC